MTDLKLGMRVSLGHGMASRLGSEERVLLVRVTDASSTRWKSGQDVLRTSVVPARRRGQVGRARAGSELRVVVELTREAGQVQTEPAGSPAADPGVLVVAYERGCQSLLGVLRGEVQVLKCMRQGRGECDLESAKQRALD